MAHCDTYREQLGITYPLFGHALWEPTSVGLGDVGYIRQGKFHRLFNALLSADHPSHHGIPLPEHHEPLIPNVADHIDRGTLKPDHYCSVGVTVETESEDVRATRPPDVPQVSFFCTTRRGGAVLSLPVDAQRQDTRARGDFGKWMIKHIDTWFTFARGLGLGIEQMEEIVLVTGLHFTRSWANVTFFEGQMKGQASLGVNVTNGPNTSINWQCLPGSVRGGVRSWGPEGENLPENQCVFIRGFRVARVLGILHRRLRGAAGPNPIPDGESDDYEPDKELISISSVEKYRDPFQMLLEHIAEEAPDHDMVLIHDDDLARVEGFYHGKETLQRDTLKTYLQTSRQEIQQILCELPTSPGNNMKTDTETTTVAMFSKELQEWGESVASIDKLTCKAAEVTNWVFLIYENQQRFDRQVASRTITNFVKGCEAIGITVNPQPAFVGWESGQGNICRQVRAACEERQRISMALPTLVVVILPEGGDAIYTAIKHFGDVSAGIATLCMKAAKCSCAGPQYFANVALKINVKLSAVTTMTSGARRRSIVSSNSLSEYETTATPEDDGSWASEDLSEGVVLSMHLPPPSPPSTPPLSRGHFPRVVVKPTGKSPSVAAISGPRPQPSRLTSNQTRLRAASASPHPIGRGHRSKNPLSRPVLTQPNSGRHIAQVMRKDPTEACPPFHLNPDKAPLKATRSSNSSRTPVRHPQAKAQTRHMSGATAPKASTAHNPAAAPKITSAAPRRRRIVVSNPSSEFETTDTDEDDDSWSSEELSEGVVDASVTGTTGKRPLTRAMKLREAALEAQRQRELFAKQPERSYSNLRRSQPGLLSQLLNQDPDVLLPGHPYRVTSTHELTRPGVRSTRKSGKSAAAFPLATRVTTQAPIMTATSSTHGSYRHKGYPQGEGPEDDSESNSHDYPGGHDQVSGSLAQRRLSALANLSRPRASDNRVQNRVLAKARRVVPTVATAPVNHPWNLPAPALPTIPTAPVDHPLNLPSPAPPTAPRATRRQMLATELSESLRRNLLWERQVSGKGNSPATASRRNVLGGSGSRPLKATAIKGNGSGVDDAQASPSQHQQQPQPQQPRPHHISHPSPGPPPPS